MKVTFINKSELNTPAVAIHFTNDKGDTLSVIKHKYAMCDDNTYEVWDVDNTDEPIGYVTPEKLTEMVNKHLK